MNEIFKRFYHVFAIQRNFTIGAERDIMHRKIKVKVDKCSVSVLKALNLVRDSIFSR